MPERIGAALVVVRGPDESGHIRLDGPLMVVGRTPDADIEVRVPEVSRRHAEITERDGGFFIRDLDSTNGTYLDDERISGSPVRLREGSSVVLGNGAVEFRFSFRLTQPQVWLRVDETSGDLWVDGRRVELSPLQFALVSALCEHEGGWVSKDDLIDRLWPEGGSDDQLTTLVHRVRRRVQGAVDPSRQRNPIINDRRRGYRLNT